MNLNALQWDGAPGHYEVYYLTLTDPVSGFGVWIRSTMRAPDEGDAECSLWFLAMHPDGTRFGRKATYPIDRLIAEPDPFRLQVGDSELSDSGYSGAFEDVRWDLTWKPGRGYEHVHPFLRRAKIAKTVLVLPHADVAVSGTITIVAEQLTLHGARGGQAHLWGSKHANRWAWVPCNDFTTSDGAPAADAFVDGVSVFVPRFGREIGPSTPVVGRFGGADFAATSPLRVTRHPSRFDLDSWEFEAVDGKRKIVGQVEAPRSSLVGVTYHDPDGAEAYCYNSEVATMRLTVLEKAGGDWREREELVSDGRAHFEYAQREPVAEVELLTK